MRGSTSSSTIARAFGPCSSPLSTRSTKLGQGLVITAGKRCCGLDAGLHSYKGNRVTCPQGFDSGDGGGIARNDDEFAVLGEEEVSYRKDPALDFVSIASPIRTPGAVAKINDRFVGQGFADFI